MEACKKAQISTTSVDQMDFAELMHPSLKPTFDRLLKAQLKGVQKTVPADSIKTQPDPKENYSVESLIDSTDLNVLYSAYEVFSQDT